MNLVISAPFVAFEIILCSNKQRWQSPCMGTRWAHLIIIIFFNLGLPGGWMGRLVPSRGGGQDSVRIQSGPLLSCIFVFWWSRSGKKYIPRFTNRYRIQSPLLSHIVPKGFVHPQEHHSHLLDNPEGLPWRRPAVAAPNGGHLPEWPCVKGGIQQVACYSPGQLPASLLYN